MNKRDLMSRSRRDGNFPVSRDWEDIDCRAVGCKYNILDKCAVPSIAKISEEGRCTGFMPKDTPKKIDGD